MDLLDGHVGHWPLDRQSYDQATHQFVDKSTEGNHGTGIGDNLGDTFDFNIDQHGIGGGATPFDGSSDCVSCGSDESLNPGSDAISISAWIKPSSLPAHQMVVSYGSGYELRLNLTTPLFIWQAATPCEGTTIMVTDTWYHMVGVYDGTNERIYVNGDQENSIACTPALSFISVDIGRRLNNAYNFNGAIADVRLYNRALSQDEITHLYLERTGVAYKAMKVLSVLEKPVRISKERSLIVLKKEKDCGI